MLPKSSSSKCSALAAMNTNHSMVDLCGGCMVLVSNPITLNGTNMDTCVTNTCCCAGHQAHSTQKGHFTFSHVLGGCCWNQAACLLTGAGCQKPLLPSTLSPMLLIDWQWYRTQGPLPRWNSRHPILILLWLWRKNNAINWNRCVRLAFNLRSQQDLNTNQLS